MTDQVLDLLDLDSPNALNQIQRLVDELGAGAGQTINQVANRQF